MNRKIFSLLIGLVIWLMVSLVGQAESKEVELRWNGQLIEMGQAAFIVKGSVWAPVRDTLEAMGANVSWDETSKTVTAKKGTKALVLQVGSKRALLNGKTLQFPTPVQLIEGRTIAPVRPIAEALDVKVEWVHLDHTVYMTEIGKISIQEAEQLVREYLGISKSSDTVVEFDRMEDGVYIIHVYDFVNQHTATRGWYVVALDTGKLESMF